PPRRSSGCSSPSTPPYPPAICQRGRRLQMTTMTISVPEIHCDHCKHSIEGALAALPGVASARVDVEARAVTVGLDETLNAHRRGRPGPRHRGPRLRRTRLTTAPAGSGIREEEAWLRSDRTPRTPPAP